MKTVLLVVVVAIASVGGFAYPVSQVSSDKASVESPKFSMEQARKIALARVAGKVLDEWSNEDDEGKVVSYQFWIRRADKKVFSVEINAETGKIDSVEEVEDDGEDPDGL